MANLGWLLERLGKITESEHWFTSGAATGDADAGSAIAAEKMDRYRRA